MNRFEQPRQQLRRNADAVVAHADLDVASPSRSRAEHDAAARVGVLRGVVEQVAEHLRQAREIALHVERVVGHVERRARAAARSISGCIGLDARAPRSSPTVDRLAAEVDLAAGDARDVEQVVDQARQVLHLPLDHIARPGELRVRRARCGA